MKPEDAGPVPEPEQLAVIPKGGNDAPVVEPLPPTAQPPQSVQHPLLSGYSGLLPFPGHWDGYIQSGQQMFSQLRLDDAVRSATLRLEARLRSLCGLPPEKVGVDLVNEAFHPTTGFLTPQSIPVPEREGLHALFRGAVQQIRNPVGHRDLSQLPGTAFDTLAFINYLLDLAHEAALARFVHPFLGKWGGPHLVEGIHRCDLNGDGADELVVITRSLREVRALCLNGDGQTPLVGALPRVAGSIAAVPIYQDLEGDGRPELLLAGGDRDDQGSWTWKAIVVDCGEDGSIQVFQGTAGEELVSIMLQFEVVRPMHLAGPVVAGLREPGKYRFWRFDGSSLTEQKDAPDA